MANYKIVVEVLGKQWKQDGKTIEEALSNFDLSWEHIKGKGVIIVSKGGLTHEHLMAAKLLRRIFSNKITRILWAKNLQLLLDGNKSKKL